MKNEREEKKQEKMPHRRREEKQKKIWVTPRFYNDRRKVQIDFFIDQRALGRRVQMLNEMS